MISIESKGAVSMLPGRAITFAAAFQFHRRGEIDFAVWFHLRSYDLPFGAKRTAVAVLAPNWRAAARCESPLHHASAMD